MSFNRTVLTVASVVFIVMLTITALIIKRNYENQLFPPEIAKCPDYWTPSYDPNDGEFCNYTGKNPDLGSDGNDNGTFQTGYRKQFPVTTGKFDRKQKCKWASENNVLWDGIWTTGKSCK